MPDKIESTDEHIPVWAKDEEMPLTYYGSVTSAETAVEEITEETETEPPQKPFPLRLFNIFEMFGIITW